MNTSTKILSTALLALLAVFVSAVSAQCKNDNTNIKDLSTRYYQMQIEVAKASGIVKKTASVTCTPIRYWCQYDGNWTAQFKNQAVGSFILGSGNRRIQIPYPVCITLEETKSGGEWQSLNLNELPFDTLKIDADEFTIRPSQVTQESAISIIGFKVVDYKVRRIVSGKGSMRQ